MREGSRRLVSVFVFLSLALPVGLACAGVTLVPPDVRIHEGDTQVEISWTDPDPGVLVSAGEVSLGFQTPWRGAAAPVVRGSFTGACDYTYLVTANSASDAIVLSWVEVSNWETKATRERTLRIDSTDFYYDFSYGLQVAVPSASLFRRYTSQGWQGTQPNFRGLYRGGAPEDTAMRFVFVCTVGGELTSQENAGITLGWKRMVPPANVAVGDSGQVTLVAADRSVEVSQGLRIGLPAGQHAAGEGFAIDAMVPFGKADGTGTLLADVFRVKLLSYEGYLVLRRSVEDRTTPTDTMFDVLADIRRCEDPGFFEPAGGERHFTDKNIKFKGPGITDTTLTSVINGFPYQYAVVTYDWSDSYNLIMSPVDWGNVPRVYPSVAPAKTAAGVFVVPNPYRFNAGWDQGGERRVQFMNVPSAATIRIYDAAGNYLSTLHTSRTLDGDEQGRAVWNLEDREGKQVVSGVYIFRVEVGGDTKIGRFIVIR
jgi:hypothetical protein